MDIFFIETHSLIWLIWLPTIPQCIEQIRNARSVFLMIKSLQNRKIWQKNDRLVHWCMTLYQQSRAHRMLAVMCSKHVCALNSSACLHLHSVMSVPPNKLIGWFRFDQITNMVLHSHTESKHTVSCRWH